MTAPSEDKMHRSMAYADMASGGARGMLAGTAAGLLAKHVGYKVDPVAAAAVGTALGAGAGGLRGRERALRDRVREERTDQRYLQRKEDAATRRQERKPMQKKSYDRAVMAAFADTVASSLLEKRASMLDTHLWRPKKEWNPTQRKAALQQFLSTANEDQLLEDDNFDPQGGYKNLQELRAKYKAYAEGDRRHRYQGLAKRASLDTEKRALANIATRVGAGVLRGAGWVGQKLGPNWGGTGIQNAISGGQKMMGGGLAGTRRLARATGYGAIAAGTAGATGLAAGGIAGRATA